MRALKFALQNFSRNPWLSTISIIMMFLMLFSIGFVYGINIIGQQIITSIKGKVDLGIYLKQNIDNNIVNSLRSELENIPQIKEVLYLTPQQSLEQFEEKHKNNPLIIKSLKELGENPLGATLTLKFHDPSYYKTALSIINKPEYQGLIQNQNFTDYQKLIVSFNNFTEKISYVGYWISGFFILVAILVIFNVIKLGALSRKKEIKIMRLVGASAWFIRTPFLIESGIYAIFAWFLSLIAILGMALSTNVYIQQFFKLEFNLYTYLITEGIMFFFVLLIFALVISIIGSSMAIKKYLKV